ncbi:MAG: N-acetylneuraminate lyase [Xylanivirga thermophila]|jgi:N-acetylneuraminate lyase|uniref:N-acetylneuraminate lyase n=1 Tax=Xylanivirga thermophila TaxID=2496273 RepID=UPI00101E09D5|nr:N-acetylneuraminate lyase [Xylanivirga thermophila]
MSIFNLKDIKGVIPALITPFDCDENVDFEKLKGLVNYLLSQGVDGFYLTGSTGQGIMMDTSERKAVVETVIDEVGGKVPIIVHVGTIDTKHAIELAKHAYEAGADAISSIPPFYYKFSFEELYGYYEDVAQSTPLPMIIYSIPATTGVNMGIDAIKKLSGIENVKGIKYTSMNHYEMQRIKEHIGQDFVVYSGADEMCVSGLMMGADGIIGSFYNLDPEIYIAIYNDIKTGEYQKANEKLKIANDVIEVCLKYGCYPSIRAGLRWMGIDCGIDRKPFKQLDDNELKSLRKELKRIKDIKGTSGIRLLEFV